MLIGYVRVSTESQSFDPQLDALKKYGVDIIHIFKEELSTTAKRRPVFEQAIKFAREGDSFVIARLDRIGRSLEFIIKWLKYFEEKGINFVSLSDNINTSTAAGKLQMHMIASFAEFERNMISERTKEGLAIARKHGKRLGRPPLLNDHQKELIVEYEKRGVSKYRIAEMIGIKSRSSIYNYLNSKEK